MHFKTGKLEAVEDGFVKRVESSRCSNLTPLSGLNGRWRSNEHVLTLTPRQSFRNAEELVKEIAATEVEIIHLERYILSLYRTAFGQCLANPSTLAQSTSSNSLKADQPSKECPEKIITFGKLITEDGFRTDNINGTICRRNSEKRMLNGYLCNRSSPSHDATHIVDVLPLESPTLKSSSSHRMLADHLCASIRESIFGTPCKLSEDLVKCISAVYCKLKIKTANSESSFSPVSSLSTLSTFSPQDQSENWSPRYYYEPTTSPCQLEMLKEKNITCSGMVQISRISVDRERFKDAAALLETHRDLVRRLEAVDPSKLNREEKLAFWINIHNAMVMHAFIAYGLENSRIRNTSSVMKMSYNVGGLNFNAYDIQTSIFGLRPHRPEPDIRSLLPVARKPRTLPRKYVYGLDRSEPLVHFALCLGACSDPIVRVYTSKNVIDQLQLAKEEFIQTNLLVHKETKIILPRILELYAKDAFLDLSSLLDIVHDCLPETLRKAVKQCMRGRHVRRVEWSPYRSTFRYVLHRDLDFENQTNPLF